MKSIKYIMFFIMIFSIQVLKAQIYEIDYTYTSEPFKLKINKIECNDYYTSIYLTVTNTALDDRALNFSKGEF